MKNKIIILSVVIIIIILSWVFYLSIKPYQKESNELQSEGRDHIDPSTKVEYKTNPPTSGKHYADWIRPGIYDQPQQDGYLVHSLEHGYIIISYNCDINNAAKDEATSSAKSNGSTQSAILSQNFKSDQCKQLVSQLTTIYEAKGKTRLIITPRPNLDKKLALTAWQRLEKFDQLDQNRINDFIDRYRNRGPEKTME